MESLDFVVDLVEKLQIQNTDYFIVTMRHGEEDCKTDVFFNVNNDESYYSLEHVLQQLNINSKINELEDNGSSKKATRKKPAKKAPPKKAEAKRPKPRKRKE